MYYHPQETVQAKNLYPRCDNLWYHIHYFQKTDHGISTHEGLEPLRERLVLDAGAGRLLAEILQHNRHSLGYIADTHEIRVVKARAAARILVGMGAAHCRETSLTLHPVYGIPYIPGSSVKGVMRNWFLQAFFGGDEQRVEDLTKDESCADESLRGWSRVFFDLFGSQVQRGFLTCLDVFLGPGCEVVPDVLTVHYPSYYQKGCRPTDSDSPKLVSFYVVKPNQPVEFVLVVEKPGLRSYESELSPSDMVEIAVECLSKALSEKGIGSKTSSGYGYFTKTSVEKLVLPEKKQAIVSGGCRFDGCKRKNPCSDRSNSPCGSQSGRRRLGGPHSQAGSQAPERLRRQQERYLRRSSEKPGS